MEAVAYHLYMFDLHAVLMLHRASVLEAFPDLVPLLAHFDQLDVSPVMPGTSWTDHGVQGGSFSNPLPRRVIG